MDLMKQMGDRKANPFQFKHLKLCHYSMAGVNKVVLASMPMPYMECGFARDLFLPMVLQPQKLLHPRLQGVVRAAWRETSRQGVRVANLVRELIIGIETVCDRRKPKYAINRTILDKNFHKQLILRMYWQRKAMKHP